MRQTLNNAKAHVAILILRVFSGIFIMTHGWPKLMKVINGDFGFGNPIGIGQAPSLILSTFAEFFCAIFVIIGLKTRWAAIPLIINMAVAGLIHHAADPFGRKEKALLFLVVFIVLSLTGSGKYSLDSMLNKNKL